MNNRSSTVRNSCRYAATSWRSWCSDLACTFSVFATLGGLASTVQAAEFLASNNASLSGEVIRLAGNTITIRTDVGSVIIVPRGDVELVRYSMNDGSTIEGRLRGWDDGTYVIDVGGKLVNAKEGVIVSEPAETVSLAAAPAQLLAESDDKIGEEAGNVEPEEGPVSAAITGADLIEINATAHATSESASTLDFDINLSKPAGHEIILLYSTVDGTAKSGVDYHAQSGVLVVPAGATSARLATPLIDDDVVEEEEFLTLFISVAPTAATVTDRQISGKIKDDDS